MKQRLFMYLFVFTLLLVIFQYANAKRIIEEKDKKLNKTKNKLQVYKDSILTIQDEILELSHFNLEKNEDALSYFERDGFDTKQLIPLIRDEIYSLNETKGQHRLVPYASSEGRKMLINTVKFLNHRWVIADFSDGEYWGEIFFSYYVNQDKTIDFELEASFLYPFD